MFTNLGLLSALYHHIRKFDLWFGLWCTLISFVGFLIPLEQHTKLSSLFFGASYYLGLLIIADGVVLRITGHSLVRDIMKSPKEKRSFFNMCLVGGTIFSVLTCELGGFWYFPYWSTSDYIVFGYLLGGWVFYLLFLVVTYEAVKLIIDKYFTPGTKRVYKYYSFEPTLYKGLFVVGCIGMLYVAIAALYNTRLFTHFTYNITTLKTPYITYQYWLLAFVSLMCICEYVEYTKKRTSLLKDTFHGYLTPLISILVIGLFCAVSNEFQNLGVFLWRYGNYPLEGFTVLGIPLFVVLTWPLQYVGILSFWRAFGSNLSSLVFAGDEIE